MSTFSTAMTQPIGFVARPYTPPITSFRADRFQLSGLRGSDIEELEAREARQLSPGTWTAICLFTLGVVLVNNAMQARR